MDLSGMAEVRQMLDQFTGKEMNNRTRRAARAGAAVFRKAMRRKGGSWAARPRTFYKTRTRGHRIPIGVSVSPQSPLSTIFEHGAKPHAIPIRSGPFAGRVIQHPGVAARPFIVPVFDAARSEAEDAFSDVLFEGV